jgi:hypothetical protein
VHSLNTSEASSTVAMLNVVDPARSPWWTTWLQFQVQYYDMPRRPGARIESPATLGRKCWAFAYLRHIWVGGAAASDGVAPRRRHGTAAVGGAGLGAALQRATAAHGLSVRPFARHWEAAVALTMPLCERVMANCFVNASYDPSARNGSCPARVDQFLVGFAFENEGGGRNDSTGAAAAEGGGVRNNARCSVAFPFPTYSSSAQAFREKYEVTRSSMATFFNFIM